MRSQWGFEAGEGVPTRATGAMIDITQEKNMLARSEQERATAIGPLGFAFDPLNAVILRRVGEGLAEGRLLVARFPGNAGGAEVHARHVHGDGDA